MVKEIKLFGSFNPSLSKKDIERILCDINSELKNINKNLSITIYGGSALCLVTNFRDSTYDIDTTCSDEELLKSCIDNLRLSKDLINTEINVFISKRNDTVLYKKLSNLEVHVPTMEFLFAMKIRSCRNKDFNDIKNIAELLGVKTLEQCFVIFKKYYSPIQFNAERRLLLSKLLGCD